MIEGIVIKHESKRNNSAHSTYLIQSNLLCPGFGIFKSYKFAKVVVVVAVAVAVVVVVAVV